MIIDVVDLKFKTLHFSQRYDPTRYKRGTQIYNRGSVTIEEVNKIDESNYEIEAAVDGNYDVYTTKLTIAGNMINKNTCTCEDYYNGNLCKHIIATSMEVIEPHYASTNEGRKKIIEQQKEEARKRAEQMKLKQELERKKREYERKYYSGLRAIETFKSNSRENTSNRLNLEELYEETIEMKNKKVGELATSIKLEQCIELENNETLKVSFKIGQTRMYVLNNICEFYEAYQNETELYYGKQLRFIPKRENFTKDSQEMLDYIIKYAEMIEYNNRYSNYGMSSSSNKFIYITKENIDEFLNKNKNSEIEIHSNYYGNVKYAFTEEKLNIWGI